MGSLFPGKNPERDFKNGLFAGQNPQNRGVFPKIEGNLSTLEREQERMCVLCLNCSDKQKSY
jgi:hypothetical protein